MMYKEVAKYSAEEDEEVTMDVGLERIYDGNTVYRPSGFYVNRIQIDGIWCDVYEYNGNYTAYMGVEEDDTYGEMVDRRYQEYVDSKYEN